MSYPRFDPSEANPAAWEGEGGTDDLGRRQGEWIFEFSGGMQISLRYDAGILDGAFRIEHPDGVFEIGEIRRGVRHGHVRVYDRSTLVRDEHWTEGRLHGRKVDLDLDTGIVRINAYEFGILDGEGRTLHDGCLVVSCNYVAGELHGPFRRFDPESGALTERGSFDCGVRHGDWEFRDSTGRALRTETWEAGELIDSCES